MTPIKIKDATRNLGPPPNVKDDECDHLWVKDIDDGRFTGMQSAWVLTPEELAAVNAGMPIILTVFSTVHPMISLGVEQEDVRHGG